MQMTFIIAQHCVCVEKAYGFNSTFLLPKLSMLTDIIVRLKDIFGK